VLKPMRPKVLQRRLALGLRKERVEGKVQVAMTPTWLVNPQHTTRMDAISPAAAYSTSGLHKG
jgi:hypothetical protein